MIDSNPLAADFEPHRRRLTSIAYRMLGSLSDAEDVVQDAFLRWQNASREDVQSAGAYLTTIVTRLCLDHLKSAQAQRVDYVGPWLPEPVTESSVGVDSEPDSQSLSLAFLVLLESLTPQERAAYLLHEVFDYSHREVASMLKLSELHCRQLFSRARKHIADRRPRFAPSKEAHAKLLGAFSHAVGRGDLQQLQNLLAEEVSAWSDGGGKATAASKPLFGIRAVSRFYAGLGRTAPRGARMVTVVINGWPALAVFLGAELVSVLDLETDGRQIYAVRAILNPDKLANVRKYIAKSSR